MNERDVDRWWGVNASIPEFATDEQRQVLFERICELTNELEETPLFAGIDIAVTADIPAGSEQGDCVADRIANEIEAVAKKYTHSDPEERAYRDGLRLAASLARSAGRATQGGAE